WGRFVSESAIPGILAEVGRIAAGAGGRLDVVSMRDYLERLSSGRRRNLERILDVDDSTHVLADEEGGFADGGSALTGFLEACLEAGVCVSLYSHVGVPPRGRTGHRARAGALVAAGRRSAGRGARDGPRRPDRAGRRARQRRPRTRGGGLGDANLHELSPGAVHPELRG